jgi:hypothetical protein
MGLYAAERGSWPRGGSCVSAAGVLKVRSFPLKAFGRRQTRVGENLHLLPKNAQQAILDSLEGAHKYAVHQFGGEGAPGRQRGDDAPTASIPT